MQQWRMCMDAIRDVEDELKQNPSATTAYRERREKKRQALMDMSEHLLQQMILS